MDGSTWPDDDVKNLNPALAILLDKCHHALSQIRDERERNVSPFVFAHDPRGTSLLVEVNCDRDRCHDVSVRESHETGEQARSIAFPNILYPGRASAPNGESDQTENAPQ